MTTAPCKYCANRHPNCHSECERYSEYNKERVEEREAKKKYYNYDAARAQQSVRVKSSMWRKYKRRK